MGLFCRCHSVIRANGNLSTGVKGDFGTKSITQGQLRKLETWKDPEPGIGLNLNRSMHAPLMAQGAFDWPAYPNE